MDIMKLERELEFEKNCEELMPSVYSLITKWNLKAERDEFVQIGRIAIYEAWLKYDPEKGEFGPFAFSYLSGEMKKAISKNDRWRKHHLLKDHDHAILTEVSPALRNEEERILLELWIEQAKLTDQEKFWVTKGLINGLKIRDISELYGYNPDTVKVWRLYALKKLRKAYYLDQLIDEKNEMW